MPTKKEDQTPVVEEVKTKKVKAEDTKAEEAVERKKEKKTEKKTEKKSEKKIEKKIEKKAKTDKKVPSISDKKHGDYYNDVEVNCICGANFTINTTVPGPIKVETCYQCHPSYNKDKTIKKVIKGRLEKFLEKQKRIDAMK